MNYWLMKSEPEVYSIDDLKRDSTSPWEGVRNYQARNFMLKGMTPGDFFLFYHSSSDPTGIAGIGKIATAATPDPTQFKKTSKYYDAKSTLENPRWHCVSVQFVNKFSHFVTRDELKAEKALRKLPVLARGQRLSIMPISKEDFKIIEKMGRG